jgi:hypothetical protein
LLLSQDYTPESFPLFLLALSVSGQYILAYFFLGMSFLSLFTLFCFRTHSHFSGLLLSLSRDWTLSHNLSYHGTWVAYDELGIIWPSKPCTATTHYQTEVRYRRWGSSTTLEAKVHYMKKWPNAHFYIIFCPSLHLPNHKEISGIVWRLYHPPGWLQKPLNWSTCLQSLSLLFLYYKLPPKTFKTMALW